MDDKLKQLYELYSRNGLIKTTDFNTFSSANESQRKQLYDLGRKNGLFNTTDYNTFSTAFSPVKKKVLRDCLLNLREKVLHRLQ